MFLNKATVVSVVGICVCQWEKIRPCEVGRLNKSCTSLGRLTVSYGTREIGACHCKAGPEPRP